MQWLVRWYDRRSGGVQLLISALAVAIPFYFSAYFGYWVSEIAETKPPLATAIHATTFIVLLTLIVFITRYFSAARDELHKRERSLIELRLHAYAQIDRLTSGHLRHIREAKNIPELLLDGFAASIERLRELVSAAYDSFETTFGKSATSKTRVDFEVTFMTRSYLDNEITIPAFANRDGRAPRSMVLRQKDAKIYENSVTAAVYREPRPSPHIIEDTADPKVNYHELYSDQRTRIKSSIVFPVLSDENVTLGTMVVHCDKAGFFKTEDSKFWFDFLEVFSKRLALVKLKLDMLVFLSRQGDEYTVTIPKPPF